LKPQKSIFKFALRARKITILGALATQFNEISGLAFRSLILAVALIISSMSGLNRPQKHQPLDTSELFAQPALQLQSRPTSRLVGISRHSTLSEGQDLSRITGEYFNRDSNFNLAMPVTLPTDSFQYRKSSLAAFQTELDIYKYIVKHRQSLSVDALASFDSTLLESATTYNLLLRIATAGKKDLQHMGAGVCIGSQLCDQNLGEVLLEPIDRAFKQGGIDHENRSLLQDLCNNWGKYQYDARTEIAKKAWENLISKHRSYDIWPVPIGFTENLSCILEEDLNLAQCQDSDFLLWFNHVDSLYQISAEKRNLNRSDHDILRDIPYIDYHQAIGEVYAISISMRDAFEFQHYCLAISSLRKVTINTPLPHTCGHTNGSLSFFKMMQSLSRGPLAPLIACILVDVEGASSEQAETVLLGYFGFLQSLASNTTWRDNSREQRIGLTFINPSQEVTEYLGNVKPLRQLPQSQALSDLEIMEARLDEYLAKPAMVIDTVISDSTR
jgi:hypothetical protein